MIEKIDKKDLFLQRYDKIYGKEWLRKDALKGYLAFRINTTISSKINFLEVLNQNKVEYIDTNLNLVFIPKTFKTKVTHNINDKSNLGIVLNPSSFFSPYLLPLNNKDNIIDLCAAPGIKSAQLILNAIDSSIAINLISIEKDSKRYFRMTKLLTELFNNKPNIQTLNIDARRFKQDISYDKILCDVPCSAEAEMIDNDDFRIWSSRLINSYTNTQKSLLAKAISLVRKDGIVLYSTCTLSPEENEEVIDWALKRFPIDIEQIQVSNILGLAPKIMTGIPAWGIKTYNEQISNCIRIIPDETYEGFFIAKIRKRE